MNVNFTSSEIILGVILAASFSCLYVSLGTLGWRGGRLIKAIFVWTSWLFVVFSLFTFLHFLGGPIGYSSSMGRFSLEFVFLVLAGFAGLLTVFVTTTWLHKRQQDKDSSQGDFFGFPESNKPTLQKAFFINLAAILGFGASWALAMIVDDIYYDRFSEPKVKTSFTIYD